MKVSSLVTESLYMCSLPICHIQPKVLSDSDLHIRRQWPGYSNQKLTKLALDDVTADGEALAGLELAGQGEQALVLHVQFVVELGQDQDLRAPVLGVRGAVLKSVNE